MINKKSIQDKEFVMVNMTEQEVDRHIEDNPIVKQLREDYEVLHRRYTKRYTVFGSDGLLQRTWRPAAFWVYAIICLFDFTIAPCWSQIFDHRLSRTEIILQSKEFKDQAAVLALLLNAGKWEPITLKENGMFHIAFGAVLGAAAYTRGREKIEKQKPGSGNQEA